MKPTRADLTASAAAYAKARATRNVKVEEAEAEFTIEKDKHLTLVAAFYSVLPGSRVRTKNGDVFEVVRSQPSFGLTDKPWLLGRKIKKDGAVSQKTQQIYAEWEIVNDASVVALRG